MYFLHIVYVKGIFWNDALNIRGQHWYSILYHLEVNNSSTSRLFRGVCPDNMRKCSNNKATLQTPIISTSLRSLLLLYPKTLEDGCPHCKPHSLLLCTPHKKHEFRPENTNRHNFKPHTSHASHCRHCNYCHRMQSRLCVIA